MKFLLEIDIMGKLGQGGNASPCYIFTGNFL